MCCMLLWGGGGGPVLTDKILGKCVGNVCLLVSPPCSRYKCTLALYLFARPVSTGHPQHETGRQREYRRHSDRKDAQQDNEIYRRKEKTRRDSHMRLASTFDYVIESFRYAFLPGTRGNFQQQICSTEDLNWYTVPINCPRIPMYE